MNLTTDDRTRPTEPPGGSPAPGEDALADPRTPLEAVGRVLAAPAAMAFGALAALRHARALHPRGTTYDARIDLLEPLGTLSPGTHDGLVRLSRGAGLPRPFPDIGGVAVRFSDAGGPGRHQDILLSSSGRPPVLRRLLVPTFRVDDAWYSSLVSFDVDGEELLFGASIAATSGRPVALTLWATSGGPWRTLAHVTLEGTRDPSVDEAVAMNPWHDGAGLRPRGLLNQIRVGAYRGSSKARHQDDTASEQSASPSA